MAATAFSQLAVGHKSTQPSRSTSGTAEVRLIIATATRTIILILDWTQII